MADIITDLKELRIQMATIVDDESILGVFDRAVEEIERLRAYEVCTGKDDCTCYSHLKDRINDLY